MQTVREDLQTCGWNHRIPVVTFLCDNCMYYSRPVRRDLVLSITDVQVSTYQSGSAVLK